MESTNSSSCSLLLCLSKLKSRILHRSASTSNEADLRQKDDFTFRRKNEIILNNLNVSVIQGDCKEEVYTA